MVGRAKSPRKEEIMTAIKEELATPTKLSSREKAAVTDETARAIIAAEVNSREEKTERLRLLRLQREAAATDSAPAKRKRRNPKDH
jgi:tRNA(Phe) wybutosine-synthesizing methylase Tyw3